MKLNSPPLLAIKRKLIPVAICMFSVVSGSMVFSQLHSSIFASLLNNNNTMPAQHGGLKFKTSIVGACNIGIKQKEGASAISLNMDIARCHGREVASIKIVNLT